MLSDSLSREREREGEREGRDSKIFQQCSNRPVQASPGRVTQLCWTCRWSQCAGLSLPSWAIATSRWPQVMPLSPCEHVLSPAHQQFRWSSHANPLPPETFPTTLRCPRRWTLSVEWDEWVGQSMSQRPPQSTTSNRAGNWPQAQSPNLISCHASTKEMALRPLQSTSLSSSSSEKQILDSPPVHFCATLAPERISHSIESSAPLHLLTGPKTVLSIYVTSTVFPHTERELQSNPFRLSFFKSFSG